MHLRSRFCAVNDAVGCGGWPLPPTGPRAPPCPRTEARSRPATSTRRASCRRPSPSSCATASRPRCRSRTSATSTRPRRASSPRRRTSRSWPTPATSPGTWASYQWLLSGQDFASIHPSLQRQAVLNMDYGLYEVVPGRIYQVRGFDLANISFIKGDTGWIVFDPLTAKETARAALELDQREARQAAGGRRRLLALSRRPLRRRARRRGRGRRRKRQGDGDRARGLHGGGDLGERFRGQRDDAAPAVAVRGAAAAQSLRPRRPGHRQEHRQRQRRADRAEPDHQARTSRRSRSTA